MTNFLCILLFNFLALLQPRTEATIIFAGDAMQHQSQLDASRRGIEWAYDDCFARVAPWIKQADYAVVNLETTLAEKNFTGYPCFASPDAYAKALADAGFDLFLNANNHTLDRRDKGLRRTLDVLDSMRVDHIGTYTDKSARERNIPFVRNINGFKVGFLNYTYGTNGIKIQGNVAVDYIDRDKIAADIAATRKAGAELVVVLPHWGDEYHLVNNRNQASLAQYMLDNGADMVIGMHPHVIQPMEMRRHKDGLSPVVYSLGNFISGMRTTDTRGGAMVKITLGRDSAGRAVVKDAAYRLVFVQAGIQGRRAHRLHFIDRDTNIDSLLGAPYAGQARAFASNALRTFNRYNVDFPRYSPTAADTITARRTAVAAKDRDRKPTAPTTAPKK